MVRADLALFQPNSFGSLRISVEPKPADAMSARLDLAAGLLDGDEPLLAALLARTVVEQRLRAILATTGIEPRDRGAGTILGQCVTAGVVGPMARRLIAVALDVGNVAAHEATQPDPESVSAMIAAIRWLLAQPLPARTGGAA